MSVHQIKAVVGDIDPPIWRRLQVRSDRTLAHLHDVLQAALGWEDYHLHSFGCDDAETVMTVAQAAPEIGSWLTYRYDFGDDWQVDLTVEKILTSPRSATVFPRCTAGRRAGPPEDCGGPNGYEDMLTALRARKGWRYREVREFLGTGRFDPETFDSGDLNKTLATLT